MTYPKRRLKILECLSNSLTKLQTARPTGVKDRPTTTLGPSQNHHVGKTQTTVGNSLMATASFWDILRIQSDSRVVWRFSDRESWITDTENKN